MQEEPDDLTAGQRELERALGSVPPAAARVDPVAAAFAAGRRSARRQVRVWRSATAAAAAAGLALAVGSHVPLTRSGPGPAVPREEPAAVARSGGSLPTEVRPPISSQSVLMLQDAVLRGNGLAGLRGGELPDARPVRPNDQL